MDPTKQKMGIGLFAGGVLAALIYAVSVTAFAQDNAAGMEAASAQTQESKILLGVRTGSPRLTLQSWMKLTREAEMLLVQYQRDRTHGNSSRLGVTTGLFLEHLDLSQTPAAIRRETGARAALALIDILKRIELPSIETVPDWDPFDESAPGIWRIRGTPISIVRMDDGPRAGESLFSARTVAAAPVFYERIRHLPVQHPSAVESWTDTANQLTGPLIPAALVDVLPGFLKKSSLGTPIWKIFLSVTALGLAAVLLIFIRRGIGSRSSGSKFAAHVRTMLTPLAVIMLVRGIAFFAQRELNVRGTFGNLVDSTLSVINYAALAWLVWLAVLAAFEWIILSPRIQEQSLNANLLRLCARLTGFLGLLLVLAFGAHSLGIPVLGVVAGLGFGGLAVALAIRPTLENLMGGLILFMDKPVQVGDICDFGKHRGIVEEVGMRSTKIRALDRTLISVPNASFVNSELINWTRCDKMLILSTIALRYETEPDQLREVLASLREMLFAHPKIDHTTVRVRFVEYGASSFDVQIRVYALTRDFSEFYAIREDVFLRVNEIVAASGTSFAFPSRTLYLGRDGGLDQELSAAAKERVAGWRRSGSLPFPDPATGRTDALAGTLDYPPRGSVGEYRPEVSETRESERLPENLPANQPDEDGHGGKR